ncbi:MAG: glycine cleavage system aminomethyltransferase GcvT [Candidatus Freyarchaeum deiterrae]
MSEEGNLRRTHLYGWHIERAYMTSFSGFEMPVEYKQYGIIKEHLAVRNSVGVFDVTHMGRFEVLGSDSVNFLEYVTSRNLKGLNRGTCKYSLLLNENGGIIDDIITNYFDDEKSLLVVNAGNREKDFNWLLKKSEGFKVKINDTSELTPMFAVQGPSAQKTLQKLFHSDISTLKRFNFINTEVSNQACMVSRTGYTGEDGFEIIQYNVPLNNPRKAFDLWNSILEAGKEFEILPCGLGARDSLRLEAGLPLYGNDMDEKTNPFEAKLGQFVNLEKENFVGKRKLMKLKDLPLPRIRIGIAMDEKGIPRPHYKILHEGKEIGVVTSGGITITHGKMGIGMGYVNPEFSEPGTRLEVVIKEKARLARAVDLMKLLQELKSKSI